MPINNQKGIVHIFLLILLIAAIGLGVYLVQNRTNIFPKASISSPVGPETSFTLSDGSEPCNSYQERPCPTRLYGVGQEFSVDVLVSSDFDAANTFSAFISYPVDKLEVIGIEPSIGAFCGGIAGIQCQQGYHCQLSEPQNQPDQAGVCVADTSSSSSSSENQIDSQSIRVAQTEEAGFISRFIDNLSSKVEAQSAAAMPVIYGKTYCSGGKPVNELNWTKVTTPDNEYLIFKSPDSYPGSVTVSTYFDRYQYPIKDDGFHTPVRLGTTYTYYLQSFAGVKSNSVSVTTLSNCTATPTPTPFPSHSATPTPTPFPPAPGCGGSCKDSSQCVSPRDGCTVCTNGVCSVPATPTPQPYIFFIKKWIEQSDDKNGNIVLSGSVPNPGFKTSPGKKALMAKITFKAKANGDALVDFKGDSAIFRNSDNQNILSITRGLTISIGATQSATPKPTPSGVPLTVSVINPNGGQIYSVGDKVRVTWKSTGAFDYCMPMFRYKTDPEGTGRALVGGDLLKVTTGSYDWVIPNQFGALTNQLKIVISCYKAGATKQQDQFVQDESDDFFTVNPSPSATPFPPTVDGKRADLYKDPKKPNFVNDQDISVFFTKCAEKGVELFGQPASVQPICDIFEDGKITVQDWAVLLKFRNKQT